MFVLVISKFMRQVYVLSIAHRQLFTATKKEVKAANDAKDSLQSSSQIKHRILHYFEVRKWTKNVKDSIYKVKFFVISNFIQLFLGIPRISFIHCSKIKASETV